MCCSVNDAGRCDRMKGQRLHLICAPLLNEPLENIITTHLMSHLTTACEAVNDIQKTLTKGNSDKKTYFIMLKRFFTVLTPVQNFDLKLFSVTVSFSNVDITALMFNVMLNQTGEDERWVSRLEIDICELPCRNISKSTLMPH